MLSTELKIRRDKIRRLMLQQGIDALIIATNVNMIYANGAMVSGYLYIPLNAPSILFVKRPNNVVGEHVKPIRKPEQLPELIAQCGLPMPTKLALEGDELTYREYLRLAACFPNVEVVPSATSLVREARSIKTEQEVELFRRSGKMHAQAYAQIPSLYRAGMTDSELSIEVERLMRQSGCLGIFRVFGQSMEIFMGSLLAGDNAAVASPYDFALGGEGLHPSLPGGANGTLLKEGESFMVDMAGNYYGYMSDMSRVYAIGSLSDEAYKAHQVCIDIQNEIADHVKPGVVCESLYQMALERVRRAGFADYFMGVEQKARFIGHGVGLEINESPVIASRISTILEPGMVFALEPKIVLPGVGPLGIENTWVVTADGVEKLTNAPEEIVLL
ncbi:MAG: aminopeptidase P family protein [Mediterranea massiliensis]|nr:aminopeptidase P family protein [Mediterranea massiliensis]